jgi:hypothetical protein
MISFVVTGPHCRFRGVGQGMKQSKWYSLFQALWDMIDQQIIKLRII